ncbi:hypothetical protein [Massilia sp. IC2-476]|uniref:hypothetical protein n=1 Tax=Massilia sp. IC2-476 TaxID=2887199 RepID=UPI001D105D41|nr:hypothetical protein [Massilia sp. IC2-476]MCC2973112.1 hypothetical protein [Massilia sp. IC2-476]
MKAIADPHRDAAARYLNANDNDSHSIVKLPCRNDHMPPPKAKAMSPLSVEIELLS